MKHVYAALIIGMGFWLAWVGGCFAQNPANAAALAAQQEAEERFKQVSAALEDLREAQAELVKRWRALEQEVQRLREECAQSKSRCASAEDVKQLAEKIKEVDAKRQADNEKVLSALEKLAKSMAAPQSVETAAIASRPASGSLKAGGVKEGYWYEVREKDTLSGIVKAYRDRGVKVTLKQVMEANPTVNPFKLRPGDKVWIPEATQ
jgi:nucleoid-associated protein YgaU